MLPPKARDARSIYIRSKLDNVILHREKSFDKELANLSHSPIQGLGIGEHHNCAVSFRE